MRNVVAVYFLTFAICGISHAAFLPIAACGNPAISEIYSGGTTIGDVRQIDETHELLTIKRSENNQYLFLNNGRLSKFKRTGGNGEVATFNWDGDRLVSMHSVLKPENTTSTTDYLYDRSGFPYKAVENDRNGHFRTLALRREGAPQWTDGRHIDICVTTKQEDTGFVKVEIAHYSSNGDLLLAGQLFRNRPKSLSDEGIFNYQNSLTQLYPDMADERTRKKEDDLESVVTVSNGEARVKVWYNRQGLEVGSITLMSGNEIVTRTEYDFDARGNWVLRKKFERQFAGREEENLYKFDLIEHTTRTITYQ